MKIDDLLSMCWRLVLRNRRRYKAVLTGIAFGTAGFIVIQSMGDSVERKLGEHLELLGEATIVKARWQNTDSYHPGEYYWKDVFRLRKMDDLVATAPVAFQWAVQARYKKVEWVAGLTAVDQDYWKTQTPQLSRGRLIGPSDVVARRKVCVLGKEVVRYLFGSADPVGETIHLDNLSFRVVGVLGGIQHSGIRRSVFVPITTGQNLFPQLKEIGEIYARVGNWDQVTSARRKVLEVLKEGHPGYESGIQVIHYPKRVEKVQSTVKMVKLFAYAALFATLILGGLGITNVMLSAVQDRTKEIGLRKALGARQGSILLQFLTEAVMIGVSGGVLGAAIGVVSVQILENILGVDTSPLIMSRSIILGLAFTGILGIASGMYPSVQASRLEAVTAMRFE